MDLPAPVPQVGGSEIEDSMIDTGEEDEGEVELSGWADLKTEHITLSCTCD